VTIDDCNHKFDFEGLFHAVTGDLITEEKHKPEYSIPFADSPKFTLSTNHVLRGDGHSYERRQHILEFSNFYVKEGKPQDIHGGIFFRDWQEKDWNRFYTFAFKCVQEFLRQGLVTPKTRSYELKRLFATVPEEFVGWLDGNIKLDVEYVKSELFEKMKADIQMLKDMKTPTMTANLKRWCKARGYKFNPHKDGGRDSRHGIDYIIVKK
jgi:coproporphyrinogen III oxidase